MRSALALLLLLAPLAASAGNWIPYTDGRAGGCFQNDSGFLYGCTPQPAKPQPQFHRREPDVLVRRETVYVETGPTQADVDAAVSQAIAQERARQAEEEASRMAWERRQQRTRYLAEQREEGEFNAPAERARVNNLERKAKSCEQHLKELGYTLMRGGVCKAPDGAFVTCPGCPRE